MKRTTIREALDRLNQISERRGVEILDEDLKGYFKNNYINAFGKIPEGPAPVKKKAEQEAYEKALNVAKLDPTFKGREDTNPEDAFKKNPGSYFDWLIRQVKKGYMSYDEMMVHKDEFTDQLVHFDAYKKARKLPNDKRDIMQIKTIQELSELINSLGGDINVDDAESASSFKSAISNIRGALQTICGFRDSEIPQEIKKPEDCLTLICENSAWELWKINSIWGAMLADTYGIDWGGGATWCTGGQYGYRGSPRKGQELYNSANQHYGYYNSNGRCLYFFQQKDNSVPRPQNKAQFTLKDNYEVSSFFHANDSSIGLNRDGTLNYSGGYGVNTSEVMAVFITQNGLLEPMKHSALKGIEPIADAENRARLEAGEPYVYAGGKIKDSFRNAIRKIKFEFDGKEYEVDVRENPTYLQAQTVRDMFNIHELADGKTYVYTEEGDGTIPNFLRDNINDLVFKYDGKEYKVNAKEHPEYLNCDSNSMFYNMYQLLHGQPYTYDGKAIPEQLKPGVRKIIVAGPDKYQNSPGSVRLYQNRFDEGDNFLILPQAAFRGCNNLEEVVFPVELTGFGIDSDRGIPATAKFILPRKPDRKMHIHPRGRESLLNRIWYDDGTKLVPEKKEEQ